MLSLPRFPKLKKCDDGVAPPAPPFPEDGTGLEQAAWVSSYGSWHVAGEAYRYMARAILKIAEEAEKSD